MRASVFFLGFVSLATSTSPTTSTPHVAESHTLLADAASRAPPDEGFRVSASASASASASPILSDVRGGTPGRTFQSPRFDGPGPNSSLVQAFNWTSPAGPTQFYEGGIDGNGDIYHLQYAAGQQHPRLYKVSGKNGTLLWSTEKTLPVPAWPDFTGNDHLLLTPTPKPGVAVVAPGVMYYNAPVQPYIAGVSLASGKVVWLVNLTADAAGGAAPATVCNMRLSSDGLTLYAHLYNGTLLLLSTATGSVAKRIDMSGYLTVGASGGLVYTMAIAEGVPLPKKKTTTLAVFSAPGNITAVDTLKGSLLWSVPDPTNATSFGPAGGVSHSPSSDPSSILIVTSGNYGDPQGRASLNAATGKVNWAIPWGTTYVSAMRYPTSQGLFFAYQVTSSASTQVGLFSSSNGSSVGVGYFPFAPYSYSFASALAVGAEGKCFYLTAETAACDSCNDDVYVMGLCRSGDEEEGENAGGEEGAASFTVAVYQKINELCHPDYRMVGLGPKQGQLTVWYQKGFVVFEASDAPEPPRQYSELCR